MRNDSPLRRMVFASMFGALTSIGALIAIPLQPVPITLQTLFTGLAGLLLGGSAGALSQIVYILLGVIGLPVFSGGTAGLGVLSGPTGGYLIGFVAAAYITGKVAEDARQNSFLLNVAALAAGSFCIYILGAGWLALTAKLDPVKALLIGVVPFLPGDVLKILAAAVLGQMLGKYFINEGSSNDQGQ
ncbi:MAG: biotin transporter BioY [Ignavibacteriales bacterium]